MNLLKRCMSSFIMSMSRITNSPIYINLLHYNVKNKKKSPKIINNKQSDLPEISRCDKKQKISKV